MRIRRRNVAWLAVLGALVGVAILSGSASAAQLTALVAIYIAALAATLIEFQPGRLVGDMQRSSLARLHMSPQAQEAVARAARRGSTGPSTVSLLDVGLIASHTGSEGMVMRRTRSISKDDDGARPYVTLHVHPSAADTTAIVRFEIIDHNGDQQYVHEMKTFMRDGQMNILADHQLPLAHNDRISGAGDGDLRVYVDGVLLGALSFTLAPSVRERNRQISRMQRADGLEDDADNGDEELSLEELLRSQSRNSRGG